jgi:hypothetical protein
MTYQRIEDTIKVINNEDLFKEQLSSAKDYNHAREFRTYYADIEIEGVCHGLCVLNDANYNGILERSNGEFVPFYGQGGLEASILKMANERGMPVKIQGHVSARVFEEPMLMFDKEKGHSVSDPKKKTSIVYDDDNNRHFNDNVSVIAVRLGELKSRSYKDNGTSTQQEQQDGSKHTDS